MTDELKLPETKAEWHKYWAEQLQAADTPAFRRFQKRGEKIDKKFKDDSANKNEDDGTLSAKLNLYNSNITMLMSMLYGRIPKVEVDRRFTDGDDDVSRVAAVILTRILNTDIEVSGEDMVSVFRNSLQDRLIPGYGGACVQYQFEEEEVVTPAITMTDPVTGAVIELAPEVRETKITNEWTDIVYNHWKDMKWSPARTHSEITWKARRSYLTKRKLKARFKDAPIDKISFSSSGPMPKDGTQKSAQKNQAEVWEIWDKDTKKVFWWTEGADEILGIENDPLELDGFFNEPPPMVANVTTSNYLPKSDYDIAADLYRQIDELEARITHLTDACKLVGCYDKSEAGIQRIFNEGVENQLIPVANWAQFMEKGGVAGAIQWVPIKEVAEVIAILTEKQAQKIQQLQQVTGMSDVMRGAASARTQRISATADKLETQFGSIRIEALQNEFARWVNDTQALKVEIIAKHYQPYCIKKQSNIEQTPDAALADQAIALIKDYDKARWRITVRPETLAIADYAQLKQDRSEFLMGLAQFMQSSAPLLQLSPQALPTLMKLLKWFLAGFRGSNECEGILDTAIAQFEKNPPKDDKPDPAVEKMKAEMQLKQQESQQKLQQSQAEFQAEMAMKRQEMQQEQQRFALQIQQTQQEHVLEMRKLNAELVAAVKEQQAQFVFNAAERQQDLAAQKEQAEIKAKAAKKKKSEATA